MNETQRLERERIKRELIEQTYADVAFNVQDKLVEQAVKRFFEFLKLPQTVKQTLTAIADSGRMGYKLSLPTDKDPDHKETVHFNEEVFDKLESQMIEYPQFGLLMQAMYPLFLEAEKTVSEAIHILEEDFPGLGDTFFAKGRPSYSHLRMIRYHARKNLLHLDKNPTGTSSLIKKFLAMAHIDRGAWTLRIKESKRGLRIAKDGITLEWVDLEPGRATLMNGGQAGKYTGGLLRAALHDVEEDEGQPMIDDDTARWAIVLFADGPGDRQELTWEVTHPTVAKAVPRHNSDPQLQLNLGVAR